MAAALSPQSAPAADSSSPDIMRCRRHCRRLIVTTGLLTCLLCLVAAPALLSAYWTGYYGNNNNKHFSWPVKLATNLLGYGSVLAVIYGTTRWWRSCKNPGDSPDDESVDKASQETSSLKDQSTPPQSSASSSLAALAGCFVGLQASYLTWGVLQERVMTAHYGSSSSSSNGSSREKFTDAQFLVFANRLLGGALAAVGCLVLLPGTKSAGGGCGFCSWQKILGSAPLLDFAYCSLTNVLSAWCQYEALTFVSFPTQVLAKASKIVPVMLMGLVVLRSSYRWHEYVTAAAISAGTGIFLVSSSSASSSRASRHNSSSSSNSSPADLLSGFALLSGYLLFDAFTSTWQSRLFTRRQSASSSASTQSPTPLQMMAATGLLSACLTATAQLQQGSFASALAFAGRHPSFVGHAALLSACSAVGQLLIFYTIKRFGAVTFAVIMTIRQCFAILLSCLLFGHALGAGSWAGLALVFGSMLVRLRLGRGQNKQQRQPQQQQQQQQQLEATSGAGKEQQQALLA